MEGPRGHRGTYREPAIVNLEAGDDSGCSLPPLPIEGSGRWAWRVLGSGCGREFGSKAPVRIRFNPDQDPQHLYGSELGQKVDVPKRKITSAELC